MIFSIRPPIVSIPRDSGITSSSNISSPDLLPINTSACKAAPKATTRSGSRLVKGSTPKNSVTFSLTLIVLVDPPTSTTVSILSTAMSASRNEPRQARIVLLSKSSIKASITSRLSTPLQSKISMSTDSESVSSSFAALAVSRRMRCSVGFRDSLIPTCCRNHSAMAWSKSSPPRAESPPVASTSKTPRERRKILTSNVPPPRS